MIRALAIYLLFVTVLAFAFGICCHFLQEPKKVSLEKGYSPLFYHSITSIPIPKNSTEQEIKQHKYTLELASLGSEDEAQKMIDQLAYKGIIGFYTPTKKDEKILYLVRSGIYEDEHNASIDIGRLKAKTGLLAKLGELL